MPFILHVTVLLAWERGFFLQEAGPGKGRQRALSSNGVCIFSCHLPHSISLFQEQFLTDAYNIPRPSQVTPPQGSGDACQGQELLADTWDIEGHLPKANAQLFFVPVPLLWIPRTERVLQCSVHCWWQPSGTMRSHTSLHTCVSW